MLLVDAQFFEYGLAEFLGHRLRVDIEDGAAHDDGLVEEPLGLRHTHERAYLTATT